MGNANRIVPEGDQRLAQLPVEDITFHGVPICAFLWERHPPPQEALLAVLGMSWDLPASSPKIGCFWCNRINLTNSLNPAQAMQGIT